MKDILGFLFFGNKYFPAKARAEQRKERKERAHENYKNSGEISEGYTPQGFLTLNVNKNAQIGLWYSHTEEGFTYNEDRVYMTKKTLFGTTNELLDVALTPKEREDGTKYLEITGLELNSKKKLLLMWGAHSLVI